jgi:hypothetical protein
LGASWKHFRASSKESPGPPSHFRDLTECFGKSPKNFRASKESFGESPKHCRDAIFTFGDPRDPHISPFPRPITSFPRHFHKSADGFLTATHPWPMNETILWQKRDPLSGTRP